MRKARLHRVSAAEAAEELKQFWYWNGNRNRRGLASVMAQFSARFANPEAALKRRCGTC
jgi:hypothetical protein